GPGERGCLRSWCALRQEALDHCGIRNAEFGMKDCRLTLKRLNQPCFANSAFRIPRSAFQVFPLTEGRTLIIPLDRAANCMGVRRHTRGPSMIATDRRQLRPVYAAPVLLLLATLAHAQPSDGPLGRHRHDHSARS